jgi:hypothetical protein
VVSAADLLLDRLNGFKWGGAEIDGVTALLLIRLHPDVVTPGLRARAREQQIHDALERLLAESGSAEPPDAIVRRIRSELERR